MATVSDPYTFTNGTVADGTEVNARFDTLYTLVNGNIDNDNLDTADDYTMTGDWTFTSGATTDTTVTLTADSLTTGNALTITSDSTSTGTRSLVQVTNDNTSATGATVATFQQDAAQEAVRINQNGEDAALEIQTAQTTTNVLPVLASGLTTGFAFVCSNADALTTGGLLYLVSNSSDASARFLGFIHNDNDSATGAIPLVLRQDASGYSFQVRDASNAIVLGMNEKGEMILGDQDPPSSVNWAARKGIVKAWVRYDDLVGATITESYNIDSIGDDDGDGVYTIAFDTDFSASDTFAVAGTAESSGNYLSVTARAAGQITVFMSSGSDVNFNVMCTGVQ